MGPTGTDFKERNREILAERLRWPPGALEVTRQLERQHPGYSVYWGTGRVSDPKPGYYAVRDDDTNRGRTFYGADAVDLSATLKADAAARRSWW
jgi:hypothetical protein